MLTKREAQDLCNNVLLRCGKDSAEVVLFSKEEALTRFANNAIHQNVTERDLKLVVQFFIEGKYGMATTNRVDAPALDAVVSHARWNAKASPEDPHLIHPAAPKSYTPVEALDEATAETTPEERARRVGAVCRSAEEKGLNASGAFTTGLEMVAVANSPGLFAYHVGTQADFQTVVMGSDSSGWAQASGWRVADIPVEALGDEAVEKAEHGQGPQAIESGEYAVVLDPYATQDLLSMLNFYGMGALAVQEGRSWMNERLGDRVMDSTVSIWDDGLDLDGVPLPFDFEGIPKRRLDVVTSGVVQGPVYDRRTAQKEGRSSTGHALSPTVPSFLRSIGPIATRLFMDSGDSSLEGMIASTERGLYITRFWYTRLVHPRDCVVTGMTRDGVFLIENGEITRPVKDLRFTQSYVGALDSVEAVGEETRLLGSPYGGMYYRVPALKIGSFNFTGSTL